MVKLKETEGDLLKTILQYLELKRIFSWRNNTGAIVSMYHGKRRFFRYGYKGSSDIFGILSDGRFLAIECKIKPNKLSEAQKAFLKRLNENGGVSIVAYSLDDVIEAEKNKWKSNI